MPACTGMTGFVSETALVQRFAFFALQKLFLRGE
jgi:hypothetical protein